MVVKTAEGAVELINLDDEDAMDTTGEPEGGDGLPNHRSVQVLMKAVSKAAAESYLKTVPGVTSVKQKVAGTRQSGNVLNFILSFEDHGSLVRFMLEEAKRPPMPSDLKLKIVHVIQPIAKYKASFFSGLFAFPGIQEFRRITSYLRYFVNEPGFESQVLVTGLPTDFVEDPDLESSYRKMLNILRASSVEFEWAKYFKTEGPPCLDPFQLVLKFGSVEQAEAFTTNSQLMFEGKPFSGLLLTSVQTELDAGWAKFSDTMTREGVNPLVVVCRRDGVQNCEQAVKKKFADEELESCERFVLEGGLYESIYHVSPFVLTYSSAERADAVIAAFDKEEARKNKDMQVLFLSEFIDHCRKWKTYPKASALSELGKELQMFRVEGNRIQHSRDPKKKFMVAEVTVPSVDSTATDEFLDLYVACTLPKKDEAWKLGNLQAIRQFFEDRHGKLLAVVLDSDTLYIGFETRAGAEMFHSLPYVLYKGIKVKRSRLGPGQVSPELVKTLQDKAKTRLLKVKKQEAEAKEKADRAKTAPKKAAAAEKPVAGGAGGGGGGAVAANTGLHFTGFNVKSVNKVVKAKLTEELGLAATEIGEGKWVSEDGAWSCMMLMNMSLKKIHTVINNWNRMKTQIGDDLIKAKLYQKGTDVAAAPAAAAAAAVPAKKRGKKRPAEFQVARKAQIRDFLANY